MMKNRLRGRNLIFRFLFANIGTAGFRLLAFTLPSSFLFIFQGFDGSLLPYNVCGSQVGIHLTGKWF